jgi:O-antigen/teichoic acid export membrane protein
MTHSSFLKDVTGVFSSNVFMILAGLAVSIILSRKLGPEGFGIYSAILVLPLIVVSFAQLGIRASSIYYIGKKQFEQADIVSSILLILILTSMLGIGITALGFALMDSGSFTPIYISLVLMLIPFRLAMAYFGGIFIGREQIARANFINWFSELIHLTAVIITVWLLDMQIVGALISILIAHATITFWALYFLIKEYSIRIKIHPEIIRKLFSMGILFAISFLIIQLNYRVDILLLKELSTIEEVGYYSLGVSIAEKLWQLPLAIGVVLMTRAANATDQAAINRTTARLVRVSFLAGLVTSVVMFLISPWVIPAIWGQNFLPSVRIIQYILPGILFISIYRVLSSRLSGIGLPQISIFVFLPSLLLNILLNLWWIPTHGAFGAVMATNVSYTLGTLAYLIVYSKIVHMPVGRIFKFRRSDFDFLTEFRKWIIK